MARALLSGGLCRAAVCSQHQRNTACSGHRTGSQIGAELHACRSDIHQKLPECTGALFGACEICLRALCEAVCHCIGLLGRALAGSLCQLRIADALLSLRDLLFDPRAFLRRQSRISKVCAESLKLPCRKLCVGLGKCFPVFLLPGCSRTGSIDKARAAALDSARERFENAFKRSRCFVGSALCRA